MNLPAARYIDRWAGVAVHLGLHAVGRAAGRRRPPLGAPPPPSAGRTWARPRRLLAIKFYGLGNIVMILPTLAALRTAVPEVEIDFLTLPGNEALLAQSGLVTRVLTVEVATFPRFVRAGVRLIRGLRAGGYDTVLDFEQFLKVSGIFGFLSGAPELIGFDTEGQHRGGLYTTRVVSTDSVHTRDLFLRLAVPLGALPRPAPAWRLPVADADRARVHALLPGDGAVRPLVVIHPGTGESYNRVALKRWEIDRFAAVADALAERHGALVAFTGQGAVERADRKSTRLNSSHSQISYAVFCLKKKNKVTRVDGDRHDEHQPEVGEQREQGVLRDRDPVVAHRHQQRDDRRPRLDRKLTGLHSRH